MYQLTRDRPFLVFAMIVANFALSLWCIGNDPVINNDGVTYLAIAQYMADGQWREAFDFYSWPFYSIFIVATSKLFFVDIETAAYLLNTLFATSLTLAFVCIVADLSSNNRRIILIAAVVILLFPSINKYRAFIIRDFGYLSCYLWSLYFIFRFCSTFKKIHLAGWLLFAGLSFLFRFEGIIFLMIAPYFLLLFSATNLPHRRKVLLLVSALIILSSSALLFWYVNDKYSALLEMAAKSGQDINGLTDLFFANIKASLGGQAITPLTYIGLLLSNMGIMLYELLRRMAGFYLIFALYAYFKRLTLSNELQRKVWLVFVFTNIATLVGFSLYNNFLVSRYTLATALTLLLLCPFAIHHIWNNLTSQGLLQKSLAGLILIVLLGISLDRLTDSTSKTYLRKSGEWLAQNAKPEDRIYSNNKLIVYYADRQPEVMLNHLYAYDAMVEFYQTKQLSNYDYLAFEVNENSAEQSSLRKQLVYKLGRPVHVEREDESRFVLIFDLHLQEKIKQQWLENQQEKRKREWLQNQAS